MLPCTLVKYKITKQKEILNWNLIGKSKPNENPNYDIFLQEKKLPN